MAKPLSFLIDAASRYAHQLTAQGVNDHSVAIFLGVELALKKWGASESDAKFIRHNTPNPGPLPPHEISWKPGRKFGSAVFVALGKCPDEYCVTLSREHRSGGVDGKILFRHLDEAAAMRAYRDHLPPQPGDIVSVWRPDGSLIAFTNGGKV